MVKETLEFQILLIVKLRPCLPFREKSAARAQLVLQASQEALLAQSDRKRPELFFTL